MTSADVVEVCLCLYPLALSRSPLLPACTPTTTNLDREARLTNEASPYIHNNYNYISATDVLVGTALPLCHTADKTPVSNLVLFLLKRKISEVRCESYLGQSTFETWQPAVQLPSVCPP
ncbi:hypothetical protein ACLKA6_008673 [Drosophila palustris]